MPTKVQYVVTSLSSEHLTKLLRQAKIGVDTNELKRAYLSPGSVSYCLLANGEPVFAGGIVNMQWHRGEAWMLPTPWFRTHIKTCFKYMASTLPKMAIEGSFKRIQATCAITVSPSLFRHLGFYSEGVLNCFGPNGESCHLYARLF